MTNCTACAEKRIHSEADWRNHPGGGRCGYAREYGSGENVEAKILEQIVKYERDASN